jgi:hypothetical protein
MPCHGDTNRDARESPHHRPMTTYHTLLSCFSLGHLAIRTALIRPRSPIVPLVPRVLPLALFSTCSWNCPALDPDPCAFIHGDSFLPSSSTICMSSIGQLNAAADRPGHEYLPPNRPSCKRPAYQADLFRSLPPRGFGGSSSSRPASQVAFK